MKIAMVTNTYTPHVGGVARSVQSFTDAYRARGHEVLVVAPTYPGCAPTEPGVYRVKALQNVYDSGFSLALPVPGQVSQAVDAFGPDVVHSHHPILLGDTAMRLAASRGLPIVFTHHTMYEHYTHYYPGDSEKLRRFVSAIATGYANLCDLVFAPSESVRDTIRRRGVEATIEVVPTGIDVDAFRAGDGRAFREAHGLPDNAFVVGHLGRLAPEKNLEWLARAIAAFAKDRPEVHVLIVGKGPSQEPVRRIFRQAGLADRLVMPGALTGDDLTGAYAAMDAFAFASVSETQGLVLTEAMATGTPVVAIDAPGAREVVRDGENGRLLRDPDEAAFAEALAWTADRPAGEAEALRAAASRTADAFSIDATADAALGHYTSLIESGAPRAAQADGWSIVMRRLEAEWNLLSSTADALGTAFTTQALDEELR
ncbi:MAG: glycosyltransferase [Azospirillaceae bacterium]